MKSLFIGFCAWLCVLVGASAQTQPSDPLDKLDPRYRLDLNAIPEPPRPQTPQAAPQAHRAQLLQNQARTRAEIERLSALPQRSTEQEAMLAKHRAAASQLEEALRRLDADPKTATR